MTNLDAYIPLSLLTRKVPEVGVPIRIREAEALRNRRSAA